MARRAAAWAILLDRFAVIGKCPNSSERCKQSPSSGLRGPPLSVPGKAARAGTPAPQCGTGVLARQIAENGLEIGQTPERLSEAPSGSTHPASELKVLSQTGQLPNQLPIQSPRNVPQLRHRQVRPEIRERK